MEILKDWNCTDGNKQRYYTDIKMGPSLPTVSLKALFLTLLIDAYEEWDVAMFNILGLFLQSELPKLEDKVLLKMKDVFVYMICDVNYE